MKNLTTIIPVLLLLSCTNQNTTNSANESNIVQPTTQYDFPADFLGAYISTDYLNELEKHGSTKKAQEKATMSTAGLYSEHESIILSNTWNFHEGGGTDYVKMVSESRAIVIGKLSKDTIYSIDLLKNGEIVIGDENNSFRLTHFSNDYKNRDYSNIVNQRILSSDLLIDGNKVQFKSSGEIKGLDSIIGYSFHEDYYDAGMQVDMIYLRYSDDRPERTFGYNLDDGIFQIFKLNCKEKDKEYDYCLVRERGELYLTFKRGSAQLSVSEVKNRSSK